MLSRSPLCHAAWGRANKMKTPICVRCAVSMRCKKNGYVVADPTPPTYWRGDMYECPVCEVQIVVGFGAAFTNSDLLPHGGVSLRFRHSTEEPRREG